MANTVWRLLRPVGLPLLTGIVILFLSPTPLAAFGRADKGKVVEVPDGSFQVAEPFRYRVRPEDNLHWLAARFYGDARQWVRIYEANRQALSDPNHLAVGQELVIPAGP